MEPETLEALKASIRKWRKNARVRKVENAKISVNDCPLCDLYWDCLCNGCPVRSATGTIYCRDSPYKKAQIINIQWECGEASGSDFRAAAREEVAFLESLLPEGETA